jgi:predicted transcriptional regulator
MTKNERRIKREILNLLHDSGDNLVPEDSLLFEVDIALQHMRLSSSEIRSVVKALDSAALILSVDHDGERKFKLTDRGRAERLELES